MGHLFKKAPHTIVILRALQLGDLLCSVPAFRALRAAFPKAHIALLGLPWAGAFVRRFPRYLDEFIEFPGWPGLPEQEPQLAQIPHFLEKMQARRFDLSLQMQGSGSITNSLVALFGARHSAGFYLPDQYRPNERFFTPYPQGEHEIRIFLRLMEFLGIPPQGEELEFPVTEEEQQTFELIQASYGLEPGRYICLHPGARAVARRLPPEKFAEVGDALAQAGYQVVLTGTEAERGLTTAITRHMRSPALDAAGKTDLGTLALLLANARLLVSNDTGVSHIAAALRTPSVILFSASDPNRWRPLNHQLHRIIVNAGDASAEDILAAAQPLLKKGSAREGARRSYANEPA
jgi:ADP-heptose:LPS heptosyltransferase